MAKKSSNPADAHRKAQRARELKKNKEERKKVREVQTVKRDTRELESDIRYLKTQTDATSKTRLTELESELAYIKKTKEEYVKEHPEAHDRVFNIRKPKEGEGSQGSSSREENQKHLYDESGKLRDPKKSIYYDAVYNPFGVPPPGMPYRERTPEQQSEDESEDEDDEDDDDDIIMPEGPPPTGQEEDENSDSDSDDSDDIPLPEGPPPPKPIAQPSMPIPPPMRMGFNPPPPGMGYGAPPITGMGFRPPLPIPVAVPLHAHQQGQYGAGPSNFRPPRPPRSHMAPHNRPPPMIQDPLSDAPTQTYQGHRIAQHALPARPPSGTDTNISTNVSATASSSAAGPSNPVGLEIGTISAAPVLRDLRKEATVFVPRGVKKRKGPGGGVGFINAAPGSGEIDDEGDERKSVMVGNGSIGLMGKLQGVLGVPKAGNANSTKIGNAQGGADDDYQKFLDGLGDLS